MMKMLVIAAALLVLSASSSFAAITCWYNASGAYSGADDANPNFPEGKVTKGNGGDYSWGYTVPGGPDTCPKTLPAH
jgi:hypothetical protein